MTDIIVDADDATTVEHLVRKHATDTTNPVATAVKPTAPAASAAVSAAGGITQITGSAAALLDRSAPATKQAIATAAAAEDEVAKVTAAEDEAAKATDQAMRSTKSKASHPLPATSLEIVALNFDIANLNNERLRGCRSSRRNNKRIKRGRSTKSSLYLCCRLMLASQQAHCHRKPNSSEGHLHNRQRLWPRRQQPGGRALQWGSRWRNTQLRQLLLMHRR